MSPYPSPSSSISNTIPTATQSKLSPSIDGPLHTVIIILSILAALLVAYIVYITLKSKKRQQNSEHPGPSRYTSSIHLNLNHPAAQIAPFGSYSHSGATRPRYSVYSPLFYFFHQHAPVEHTPGEDMRIAVRRPDGGWNFTSQTPFEPSGVRDLDNVPSLKSSSASIASSCSNWPIPPKKVFEVKDKLRGCDPYLDFDLSPTVPPPPAYHPASQE